MTYNEEVNATLKNWLKKNEANPYATKTQKKELSELTALTDKQITNWLINARLLLKKQNSFKE